MRREGSAFQGLGVVTLKELSDHLTGIRMVVMEWLVVLIAVGVVYNGIHRHDIREVTSEDPFLLLRLFTRSGEGLPSFVSFVSVISFLVPLVAIGIGFDLVNSERNQRTLSRILAQPIYRDALLFGKFLAGLVTLAIMLVALWLMVIGLGILMLGVPPGGEEVARAAAMLGVTIVYAGVWLALALLLSILFRSAATALIVALGLWLFFTMVWPMLSPFVAAFFISDTITTPTDLLNQLGILQAFARLSPGALYGEIVGVLLDPTVQSTQQPLLASLGLMLVQPGAVPMQPLPFMQSLLIVWPQTVAMIAAAIMLFVIGYVVFQRQEVRA
jgi:ABC-2 type transport system permease protein